MKLCWLNLVLSCIGCMVYGAPSLAPLYGLEAPDVRPGEYIVGLRPAASDLAVVTLGGVNVVQRYSLDTWRALMVTTDNDGLVLLRSDPSVEYVEANSYSVVGAEMQDLRGVPEDPTVGRETEGLNQCNSQNTNNYVWGLTRTSSRYQPNWSTGLYYYGNDNGYNVDIYVVDTGVYLAHNEFGGRAWHGHTASDVRSEGNADLNGHGTHVAGTTAGFSFGVAKNANIVAVKVLDRDNRGTIRDFIEGVQWATQHHQSKQSGGNPAKSVMNLSLGAFSPSPSFDQTVEAAVRAGIPVVVAAMNNNRDACEGSPSRVATAITVAASTISDTLPSFSNYGTCVDIIAPGDQIRSAAISSPWNSMTMSGTSMAAPHVAGAVARYLSNFSSWNVPAPAQVMSWLEYESTKYVINLSPPKDSTPNRLLYVAC